MEITMFYIVFHKPKNNNNGCYTIREANLDCWCNFYFTCNSTLHIAVEYTGKEPKYGFDHTHTCPYGHKC